ncbi:unnamed protein product [Rhizoctonia solani]|uniref:Uncharacterized protein n=1 Tax=Rhizoctonia solani TaxID=456999 RepID=A0A8H3H1P2_9AGAM|nr:unnamed protein product [Rhizoctonia solani]
MESDRRHPLDTLGSLVWDLQSDESVVYRTEQKLAIPCLQGQDEYARVRELLKEAKEFYEWPPPPRSQSDRGTKRQRTGQSKYDGSLDSVSENEPNNISIDPYEDSDDSFDSEELEPPNNAGPTRQVAGEG